MAHTDFHPGDCQFVLDIWMVTNCRLVGPWDPMSKAKLAVLLERVRAILRDRKRLPLSNIPYGIFYVIGFEVSPCQAECPWEH